MKALKWVAIVIGVVLVLMIAAAIIIPLVVNPNDYKGEIAAAVDKATGRKLTIDGDIGLSVWPSLSLELGKVALGNPPGFGDQPFARIESASVSVALMPLLSDKLEAESITLDGMALDLQVKADGSNNWADLAGGGKPEEAVEAQEAESKPGAGLAALAIGGINIRDARLSYNDEAQHQKIAIEGLKLVTGPIAPNSPIAIEAGFRLIGSQPKVNAEVNLGTTVELDLAAQRYTAKDLKLAVRTDSESFDITQADLNLSAQVLADLGAQTIKVSEIQLGVDGKGGAFPGGALTASVRGNLGVDLGKDQAQLGDLVIEGLGLHASGKVDVAKLKTQPVATGNLSIAEFSPRELIRALGAAEPLTTDPEVLKKASAELNFQASAASVALPKLTLHLDDTLVDGNLSAAGLGSPDHQSIKFKVAVDAIDVDRYLPPAAPGEAKPAAAEGEAAKSQPVAIPLDVVRALNLDGVLDIGKLKVNNLRSENVHLTVKAKDGVLDLDPFKADLYQGSGVIKIRVDARKDTGSYRLTQDLSGVQIGPLLKDLSGSDKIEGTADIHSAMTSSGNTPEAMTKGLNGDLRFEVANGAVKGVNIGKLIRNAKAMLNNSGGDTAAATEEEQERTDFTSLNGTARITNGVVTNNDLDAKSPLLRVIGEGKVDLPAQQIDYLVKTVIVGTAEGQGGKELADLKGLPIPVRISGSFAEPKYKVDLGKVLEEKAKDKLKQKLEDKLKGSLGGALGGSSSSSGDAASPAAPTSTKDAIKQQLFKGLFGK